VTLVNAEMVKEKRERIGKRRSECSVCVCLDAPHLRSFRQMAFPYTRRLSKELAEIHTGTPVGINLVNADTLEKWLFTIEVMGTSEYEASSRYHLPLSVAEIDPPCRERSSY